MKKAFWALALLIFVGVGLAARFVPARPAPQSTPAGPEETALSPLERDFLNQVTQYRREQALRLLQQHPELARTHPGYYPLQTSLARFVYQQVSRVVERGGPDISARLALLGQKSLQYQSLMDFRFGGDPLVTRLLSEGTDVNQADQNGLTALHLAILCSSPEQVRALLKAGARMTPLRGASCRELAQAMLDPRLGRYYRMDPAIRARAEEVLGLTGGPQTAP